MLEIQNLRASVAGNEILKGIDLTIGEGEIHAIMDTEETLLRAGDILIQRGTNHSWSVRGTEPAIVAAILIGAKPLGLAAKARRKAAAKKAVKKITPARKAAAKKVVAKKAAVKKPVAKKSVAKKAGR